MASHGGFIGVAAGTWYIARKNSESFWLTADLVCSLAPAGLLLGRIANFLNGELWGKVSHVSWAVLFSTAPDGGTLPRHPSQLYQAFLEGFVLLAYSQIRIWKTPVLKQHPGSLVGEFLIGYSILRIVGEQFREPDAALTLGMSRGTTLSLLMAIAGAIILVKPACVRPPRSTPRSPIWQIDWDRRNPICKGQGSFSPPTIQHPSRGQTHTRYLQHNL